jgi:hypothetical protein
MVSSLYVLVLMKNVHHFHHFHHHPNKKVRNFDEKQNMQLLNYTVAVA